MTFLPRYVGLVSFVNPCGRSILLWTTHSFVCRICAAITATERLRDHKDLIQCCVVYVQWASDIRALETKYNDGSKVRKPAYISIVRTISTR